LSRDVLLMAYFASTVHIYAGTVHGYAQAIVCFHFQRCIFSVLCSDNRNTAISCNCTKSRCQYWNSLPIGSRSFAHFLLVCLSLVVFLLVTVYRLFSVPTGSLPFVPPLFSSLSICPEYPLFLSYSTYQLGSLLSSIGLRFSLPFLLVHLHQSIALIKRKRNCSSYIRKFRWSGAKSYMTNRLLFYG
jgi:hypothetical protein